MIQLEHIGAIQRRVVCLKCGHAILYLPEDAKQRDPDTKALYIHCPYHLCGTKVFVDPEADGLYVFQWFDQVHCVWRTMCEGEADYCCGYRKCHQESPNAHTITRIVEKKDADKMTVEDPNRKWTKYL